MFKTQNLKDEFFYYGKPSVYFNKIGEISDKKSRREKKKQYCLQCAQNLGTPTIDTNTTHNNICNSGVHKDPSYITHFKCDKKSYYVDKSPEPKKNYNTVEN